MAVVVGVPAADMTVPPPPAVEAVPAGRRLRSVWENEVGGLTFEVGEDPDRCFVKWAPGDSGINLTAEVARLGWAATFTVVPRVLAQGSDDAGSWIVTAVLSGQSAVSDQWRLIAPGGSRHTADASGPRGGSADVRHRTVRTTTADHLRPRPRPRPTQLNVSDLQSLDEASAVS